MRRLPGCLRPWSAGALLLGACCSACSSTAPKTAGRPTPVQIPAADANSRFVDGAKGTARITYQPNVHVVEREDALASLVAVSDDGTTLLFDTPPPAVESLAPGDVLVVKGLFAARVVATKASGPERALLIAPAPLGAVVRDGTIELNVPFRFSSMTAGARESASPFRLLATLIAPPVFAQAAPLPNAHETFKNFEKDTGLERLRKADRDGEIAAAKTLAWNTVKGVFSGWKVTYAAAPVSGGVHLVLTMTKAAGGFLGLITVDGTVGDFDLGSRIAVDRGVVAQLETQYSGMQGVMNVSWEIAKETPGGYSERDMMKLPGALTIPLYRYLDGFPLFLEVSAAAIVQPVLTAGTQYSSGAFRVRYDGRQGFTVREGKIDTDGNVTGQVNFLHERSLSATTPVAMVVNLAAPRIELTLNPYKMLGDVLKSLNDVSLFEQVTKGSKTASTMGKILAKGEEWLERRQAGSERVNQLAEVLKRGSDMMNTAADVVKSDAAAYIQLVATSASTSSGASVIAPCTHTDLAMRVSVGASAEAIGQKVGSTSKTIFEHKVTRVDPPGVRVCEY